MSFGKKFATYAVLFSVTFLFGWESASYYIIKQSATHEITQENVSPVAAFTSLIMPLDKTKDNNADLSIFWHVWDMMSKDYIDTDELNNQKMVYGAIKGMVGSVHDPYTYFMDPDDTKEFTQNLNGQLEGIGAELTIKEGNLFVVTPLKDSPAEKAGLLAGDLIYKIDDVIANDMTLYDAVMKIRGEKGTNVILTVIRENETKPIDVSITRMDINVDSVTMESKEDGIYLLNIYKFGDKTADEFEEKIQKLVLLNPKGIILDLRNNGGGYLDVAVDIASKFIKNGKVIVSIKSRNKDDNQVMKSTNDPVFPDVPVVVLINGGSASASEILAGALQDLKRGILIGEQSFGKGTVQEVTDLRDGSSIRMTIAKWYTPNDININKVGITPDIEVKFDDNNDEDVQLSKAVEYLKNL